MVSKALVMLTSDRADANDALSPALNDEGFAVLAYRDVAESMRKLYETLPDAIVMEDHLSIRDSVDFCFQIRQLSCMPVVLLGDEGADVDLICAFERGADFYMGRPINFLVLAATVKSLLRRQDEYLQRVRRLLNVEKRSVVMNGRSVMLTRTEFRLLAYMMMNRDRFVPAQQLLVNVWPGQAVSHDSARFYVSRLRHKLDSTLPDVISNRRGVGYRLAEWTESGAVGR